MKNSDIYKKMAKKAEFKYGLVGTLVLGICGGLGYRWSNDLGFLAGYSWLEAGIVAVVISSPLILVLKYYELQMNSLNNLVSEEREIESIIEMQEEEEHVAYLQRQRLRDEEIEHARALHEIELEYQRKAQSMKE